MVDDRRTRRAHAPLLALEYYLDAERTRSGASAVGIFVNDEVLVTSASDAGSREELALLVANQDSSERDLYLHPMRVGAGTMSLASIDARVRSFSAVERSVVRILAG